MEKAIPLALLASVFTATSSVCQRLGARDSQPTSLDVWLLFRLARRPIWLAGIASMILGFVFQLTALHYGPLALVQPILALELLFVFGYMAVLSSRTVRRRDWLAAAAMSAGLGLFLFAASPSGGRQHAPGSLWVLSGLVTIAVVIAGLAAAFGLRHRRSAASTAQRTAVLGAVTGVAWGFVAAVIKEFSSHLDDGAAAIFSNWSVYVLLVAGARACCWPRTRWPPARSRRRSPASRSWIRSPPACSGSSCSVSISRPAPATLPSRRSRWPSWSRASAALSHSHLIDGEDDARSAADAAIGAPAPQASAVRRLIFLGTGRLPPEPTPARARAQASQDTWARRALAITVDALVDRRRRTRRVAEDESWLTRSLAMPGQGLRLDATVEHCGGEGRVRWPGAREGAASPRGPATDRSAAWPVKGEGQVQPGGGPVYPRFRQARGDGVDHGVPTAHVPLAKQPVMPF